MKLENMHIELQKDGNLNIDCTVTHSNNSKVTAVKAYSFFSVENPDGLVLTGDNYTEDVCLAPNDVHKLIPFMSSFSAQPTHLALVMPHKTVRISVSMVLYQVALNKEFELKIDEDSTRVVKVTETFNFEKNKRIFNLATWIMQNGKAFDVRVIASLSNELPMPEICGDLSLELQDASGKTLDEILTPTTSSVFGGALIWRGAFRDIKKKDLKGSKLRASLKILSVIEGSEGTATALTEF